MECVVRHFYTTYTNAPWWGDNRITRLELLALAFGLLSFADMLFGREVIFLERWRKVGGEGQCGGGPLILSIEHVLRDKTPVVKAVTTIQACITRKTFDIDEYIVFYEHMVTIRF